jgi:hypothetical protein
MLAMSSLISLISIALIAAFVLLNIASYGCIFRFLIDGTNFSAIPLLGGILGSIGFFLSVSPALRQRWWLPLILDYGSVPCLVCWMVVLAKKGLQRI